MKIINVVGARPNFIKIAPLMAEFGKYPAIDVLLVHTGQHYDERMSDLFFRQLSIPEPDINLGVGSGSHAVQTAEIMKAFEPAVLEHRPDAVLVVGDVNSTVACGLVAVKLGVKLIHVEAGLRSGDRTMPEEINRIVTDSMSSLLFCTEQSGVDNLLREGKPPEEIHLVGNVMIDTLLRNVEKVKQLAVVQGSSDYGLGEGKAYALLTMHRPSNVDDPVTLSRIVDVLEVMQRQMPILFPVHPRTREKLARHGLGSRLADMQGVRLLDPLGYLDFLGLMVNASIVLTDSGGLQEETTALRIPCITLRENTERPVTLEVGTNQLVGTDPQKILAAFQRAMRGELRPAEIPPFWDGRAAGRIVRIIERVLAGSAPGASIRAVETGIKGKDATQESILQGQGERVPASVRRVLR